MLIAIGPIQVEHLNDVVGDVGRQQRIIWQWIEFEEVGKIQR